MGLERSTPCTFCSIFWLQNFNFQGHENKSGWKWPPTWRVIIFVSGKSSPQTFKLSSHKMQQVHTKHQGHLWNTVTLSQHSQFQICNLCTSPPFWRSFQCRLGFLKWRQNRRKLKHKQKGQQWAKALTHLNRIACSKVSCNDLSAMTDGCVSVRNCLWLSKVQWVFTQASPCV